MIERLGDFNHWLTVLTLKADQRLRRPDFLNCTFSQEAILVTGDQLQVGLNQLELDGGTATVQNKYFHQINSTAMRHRNPCRMQIAQRNADSSENKWQKAKPDTKLIAKTAQCAFL